jgi:serine/threonine protein kinase
VATQTIADRYRVERSIGRGGMGTVWLARDERLGRGVAIKQIGTLPGETAPDLARAMREARSSAVLNHPHVVSVYDVMEEGDDIWLVMEYVPSRTLWQIINEDGPLSPEAAAGIGAQVADGLAAAHAVGIVHRDVKPGNILVSDDQTAKISDFGIARAHDQGQLTSTGMVIGTPEYFSPQLARGEDPTPADDVWALGATLFTAVEGRPPYAHQGSALALLATIASTLPPRAQNAGLLTEPIGRMLDPNPATRWSMSDAAHMLRRLYARQTRESTRPTTPAPVAAVTPGDGSPDEGEGRLEEPRRRRPGGILLLVGLVGLLALALATGFLLLHGGAQDQPSATRDPGSAHKTRALHPSGATHPATPPPSSSASAVAPTATRRPVTGGSGQQFVRDYYAMLPSGTRSAWAALSPGFQARIGGYGNYTGFWSTISSVVVNRSTTVGSSAVDVSLTYTSNDGRVDHEVRRIYLERRPSGYLITGDAVVG